MTTPRPSSGTWFRKIVLIDPLDSDIQCCRASLRIAHDEKNQVQSISLAFKTKFRETKAASGHSVCRPLSVYLTFPSKIIKKRELHQRSNDKLCPSNIREKLNSSGNTPASSVITMQLELSNFGTVAYPSGLWESMRLADMKDEGFAAFAKICRSESLRLHLMYRQLNVDNLHILSGFFSPKGAISMQDESFDHARHGYLEGDWKNLTPSTNLGLALPQHFPPPDYNQSIFKQVGNDSLPPAYSEDYLRVGNKRSRGPRKTSPCGDKRRRVSSSIPPIVSDPLTEILGSPTEVNTPSVCSLRPTELFESLTEANTPSVCSPLPGETDTSSCYSPSPHSIRPTDFNPASSLGRRKWGQLHPFVKKLQTESDTLKREVLALSGRSCSPTRPQDIDCEHGVEFESGGNDDRLDSAIGQALRAYIDSAIRRKVEHFVNDAKRKIEQYFEKAMETLLEESSDRMYDLIQEAGGDLRDQADDCMVEIRDTTTEGLEELKEEIQKQTQAMDDYATERLDMIDDHASRITSNAISRPERFLCARRNSI